MLWMKIGIVWLVSPIVLTGEISLSIDGGGGGVCSYLVLPMADSYV